MKKFISILVIITVLAISLSACDIDSLLSDTDLSSTGSSTSQDIGKASTTDEPTVDASDLTGKEKFEYVIQKNFKDCVCETDYIESANIVNYTVQYDSLLSLRHAVKSMQLSIYKTLKDLNDSDDLSVTFKVLFPVTDDYGNTSYSKVLFARYSSDTLSKVNWDNFISDKVDNIADTFEIDSQLKQYLD